MKLKQKILLIALLPLLVLGIAITVVSNSEINKAMDETIQNGLRGTAISMRSTFRQLNNEPYMLDENGDLVKGDFNISEYTDMADEMVEYSKNNILAQAGQSMLTQANQQTQGVLSLLQ